MGGGAGRLAPSEHVGAISDGAGANEPSDEQGLEDGEIRQNPRRVLDGDGGTAEGADEASESFHEEAGGDEIGDFPSESGGDDFASDGGDDGAEE